MAVIYPPAIVKIRPTEMPNYKHRSKASSSSVELPMLPEMAQLYATFAKYGPLEEMQGCPCCFNEQIVRKLLCTPLRELSMDGLGRYCFKAMTTWGNANDFRYFLPRIAELILLEDSTYSESLKNKLLAAEWETWPLPERTAIIDYCLFFLQWMLDKGKYYKFESFYDDFKMVVSEAQIIYLLSNHPKGLPQAAYLAYGSRYSFSPSQPLSDLDKWLISLKKNFEQAFFETFLDEEREIFSIAVQVIEQYLSTAEI
ncbi:MAG: hypothetical protein K0S74_1716 [Chlamydiales bacterium]|jgi:hypothetical protein|nr:hypothetical protein [Chlamydiales bacterium]